MLLYGKNRIGGIILCMPAGSRVDGHYKKHALFCYYAIKRKISTKLIGENMFCMKAHQLSIVLPSKSRLVQLRIYTRRPVFSLVLRVIFPE